MDLDQRNFPKIKVSKLMYITKYSLIYLTSRDTYKFGEVLFSSLNKNTSNKTKNAIIYLKDFK